MQVPGWYADPFGRHDERFHDGVRWTPYVKRGEEHAVEEPVGPMLTARSLAGESVLVVRQRAKLVELTDEYDVLDAAGTVVGSVHEVGQGAARTAVRALTSFDTLLTHRLEVRDAEGSLTMAVVRRAPNGTRNGTVVVNDQMGQEIGRFEQQWRLGKTRFGIHTAQGVPLGYLNAAGWLEWDYRVVDLAGTEVARIDKSWRGLATELFTTADAYVVRIEESLGGPLRQMATAAALAIDLVRKQADGSGLYAGAGFGVLGSLLD